MPQVREKLGCSEQTFYRWRTKFGALKEDEALRLKILETENSRLKRIVAEQVTSNDVRGSTDTKMNSWSG